MVHGSIPAYLHIRRSSICLFNVVKLDSDRGFKYDSGLNGVRIFDGEVLAM